MGVWRENYSGAMCIGISKKKADKEDGRIRVLFFMGFGLGSKVSVVLLSQEAHLFM
ncbi:hypothetical protein Hanom_Chr00s155039g01823321 [Helianthus anomalus]